ncbi:MAG: hypothetical protein ABIN48_15670 [Ginsengibacter sp.]
MKVLSFFSKFTLICNVSFAVFAAVNKFGHTKPAESGKEVLPELDFLKNIIITLGFSAIVINLMMCLVYAFVIIAGKKNLLPKWLSLINFLFLLYQFYFYFL